MKNLLCSIKKLLGIKCTACCGVKLVKKPARAKKAVAPKKTKKSA